MRVLLQAPVLLPCELEVRGELLDRGPGLDLARLDLLDLRLRGGLLALQGRQAEIGRVELRAEAVEVPPRRRGRLRLVGQGVLVLVEGRVEGGLRELGLLVGEVDLRRELLELAVLPGALLGLRVGLAPRLAELPEQSPALLAVGLLPGRERGLAGLPRVQAQEDPLDRLPGTGVVLDHHADEDDRQNRARREEDAVQLRDVVVMVDRLGGGLSGHSYQLSAISSQLSAGTGSRLSG